MIAQTNNRQQIIGPDKHVWFKNIEKYRKKTRYNIFYLKWPAIRRHRGRAFFEALQYLDDKKRL